MIRIGLIVFAAVAAATCAQEQDRNRTGRETFAAIPSPRLKPPPGPRQINDAGLKIIEESEGLRLDAYQLAGQWLIGYGHASTAAPGMAITAADAEDLLREDLRASERALTETLPVPVNRNEYSALVSLVYNLGITSFRDTLVYRLLKAGDRVGAADAFRYLDSARIDGEMRELPALKARREKERALFLTPVWPF